MSRINIPANEKPPIDKRIDTIRLVESLSSKIVNAKDGLKDQVKAVLHDKKSKYVTSELCVGALQNGSDRGAIRVKQFMDLCKEKEIPEKDIYACLTVSVTAVEKFLTGDEIKRLRPPQDPPISLCTEFRDDVDIDLELLADRLPDFVKQLQQETEELKRTQASGNGKRKTATTASR